MAQDDATGSTEPGFFDNAVLDQFEIPFGAWMDQAVDWIDTNLDGLLQVIEWPFDFLLTNFVDDFLVELSWVWVCLAFFVLGSLVRNIKVGAFSALALAACGILGNAYWIETARTIGFIFVAVLLCVIIGIPIGVLCGRVDGIWKVVRPLLDAMQVVHSFVYMLPFIFFFGIGSTSATMVTMVFALPPLIRLTNLGIRQVPEDVVEASRAYGAPEWRVLADVQLPLARPAIMTGLNQTLLLAISMLGIAAIMGAGGLGRLLFNALSNQDVAKATSAGLAFFLVAVVLDRISQREEDGGSLWQRIRLAWAHRKDPEVLIPVDDAPARPSTPTAHFAETTGAERMPMMATAGGAVLIVLSVFLTWTSDAGKMSAYGRRVDEDLPGESFNGLAASGGSWFGIIMLGLALFAIGSVVLTEQRPGKGPRWLTTDGAVISSLAMLVMMVAYVLAGDPPRVDVGTGIGVWLALIGAVVAAGGSVLWIRVAPHTPLHPLSADVSWGRVVGVGIAVSILFGALFSGWSYDARQDVVLSPEIEARIAELQQEARDNPEDAGPIGAEISATLAAAQSSETIITDGKSSDGPQLGIWSLLAGVISIGTVLFAAGVFGLGDQKQWAWSAITAGLGFGIAIIATAWIATHVRSADPNYVSGVGSFLALCGGAFIAASSGAVLSEFRRTKIYDDEAHLLDLATDAAPAAEVEVEAAAEELV